VLRQLGRFVASVNKVNDAFCCFTGRSRAELLSEPAIDSGVWHNLADRDRLIDEVRTAGVAENVIVRVQLPDGTVRVGETTARLISLAGTPHLLSTVDDVTERHRIDDERAASRRIVQ
jgi:PAS domain S-box-containing protein